MSTSPDDYPARLRELIQDLVKEHQQKIAAKDEDMRLMHLHAAGQFQQIEGFLKLLKHLRSEFTLHHAPICGMAHGGEVCHCGLQAFERDCDAAIGKVERREPCAT